MKTTRNSRRAAFDPLRASRRLLPALILLFGLQSPAVFGQAGLADDFNPGAPGDIDGMAIGPDGTIWINDGYTHFGTRQLTSGGSVDWSLPSGLGFAIVPDGRILIAPEFNYYGGYQLPNVLVARVARAGNLDTGFQGISQIGSPTVYGIFLQVDGKIVVCGSFVNPGAAGQKNIIRLNTDGSLDSTFMASLDDFPDTVSTTSDGKLVVGGVFTQVNGVPHTGLVRLNADGSLDTGFNPGTVGDGVYNGVFSLAQQPDGKILVGGAFNQLGGQNCTNLGRLNLDGSLDQSFAVAMDGPIFSLALQADGAVFLGGGFGSVNGQARANLARVHSDGSLDVNFNPGADSYVYDLEIQPDGKILVGGDFSNLGGQSRAFVGRLNNTYPATEALTAAGGSLTWIRGGASPELRFATFDYSTNAGASWVALGAGAPMPGGWRIDGVTIPAQATLRGRGYRSGTAYTDWYVEDVVGGPAVLELSPSTTNAAGNAVTIRTRAGGTGPISYQWYKDGLPLHDGGILSGAQTSALTLAGVLGADAGSYSLVLTNAIGSATSAVVVLTVIDPNIVAQPTGQTVAPNGTAMFNVEIVATAPVAYQWRKDGVALAGATESTLTVSNAQTADLGFYDVVLTNIFSAVTSSPARLRINRATLNAFNPGTDAPVWSLAPQLDGKLLVMGPFLQLAGQPCPHLGRLNPDATLDVDFNPVPSDFVNCAIVLPGGKIVVGGAFTNIAGQSQVFLARLNPNGSLDSGFQSGIDSPFGWVNCLALQPDGKIVAGGIFTTTRGGGATNLARFNLDGSLDTSFRASADYAVWAIALQTDGKVLVGGAFGQLDGEDHLGIGRLNSDGSVDATFHADTGLVTLAYRQVFALTPLADGRILVGGEFEVLENQPFMIEPYRRLGRLNTDGSLDGSFATGPFGDEGDAITGLVLQTDGKILISGSFSTLFGQDTIGVGRLQPDGSLDDQFNPGANRAVSSLALHSDGSIFLGGPFHTVAGQSRTNLARLNNTGPATQALAYDGAVLTWTRTGTGPEAWRATFDYSMDGGNTWTSLGAAARSANGWTLAGLALPPNTAFRAQGFVAVGGGSSYYVESVLRPQLALYDVTRAPGAPVSFSLGGPVGATAIIESSPDLQSWAPVQTNILGAGTLRFTAPAPAAGAGSAQFYRLRQAQ